MNILQQEDIIKGLGDDRLMQEAKAPSGQVPQFLIVSEIQRRTDMRKRYEAGRDQPEGTIAEQIMNGGIGSIQRPPEGQGGPPPQMPQQLPQGQGISPNPNQFPPAPPPNAEMAPQGGMAAGGITRMYDGGGTFAAPWNGQTHNINTRGYPTDQVAWEEFLRGNNPQTGEPRPTIGRTTNQMSFDQQGNLNESAEMNPVDAARRAAMPQNYQQAMGQYIPPNEQAELDINHPMLPSGSFGPEDRSEANVGRAFLNSPEQSAASFDKAYNALPEVAAASRLDQNISDFGQAYTDTRYSGLPSMTAGHGDMLSPAQEKSVLNPKDKNQGDWYDPAVTGISNLVKWRGGRSGTPRETNIEDSFAEFDDVWSNLSEVKGVGALLTADMSPEELQAIQLAQIQEEDALGQKNLAAIEGAIRGSDPSADQQRADAEGVVQKGGKSANTAAEIGKLIASQRKMAWSNALIQMGAGIAGNDMEGGLSRAGDAMAAGQTQVNRTTEQNMRQNWSDEQQERQLSQRRDEVEAGYGSNGRNGIPADVQSAQWFMNLEPDQQAVVMKYKGRALPNAEAQKIYLEAIGKRAGDMNPMSEGERHQLQIDLGLVGSAIPQAALAMLKADPSLRDQFIAKYGSVPEGY